MVISRVETISKPRSDAAEGDSQNETLNPNKHKLLLHHNIPDKVFSQNKSGNDHIDVLLTGRRRE
jgi:hypothetical protein